MKKTIFISSFCMMIIVILTIFLCHTFLRERYYCEDEDLIMRCAKISITNHTCYPHNCGYKDKNYCSSEWVNLNVYEYSQERNSLLEGQIKTV